MSFTFCRKHQWAGEGCPDCADEEEMLALLFQLKARAWFRRSRGHR